MITICIPCGYIYQGKEAFQSLPGSWVCPDCGTEIKNFAEIDEKLPESTEKLIAD